MGLLPLQTATKSYWTDKFQVTDADLEFIYNQFLEEETPLRTPDLIQRLIQRHVENEQRTLKRYLSQGQVYQPAGEYSVGQQLVFPLLDFALGEVIGERPGENAEYGSFTVIQVQFEDGETREYASRLQADHKLNSALDSPNTADMPSAEKIYQKYKRVLTPIVVDRLREDEDTVFIAGRWFLKSLLVASDQGVLNLSEAVLVMSEGGPIETQEIAAQIGFGQDTNEVLRGVSLDYALSRDDRFDEVGPAGKVWWFLKQMEPPEIHTPPEILRYRPINYNPDALTDELIDIEVDINDEFSDHILDDEDEDFDEAGITLTYPHWRMGTLPLTHHVDQLVPVAYRAPRIRVTLVDAQGQQEMDAWVVRDAGYIYGLGDFYQRHQLPIGGYITVRRHDDPTRMIIDFDARSRRQEYVKMAIPGEEKLRFRESQQYIGASFDDLMLLGIEDIEGLDRLAARYRQHNTDILRIMSELMGELAQFSPQRYVHAKTLYSAVNMLRRCPPAPLFATLNESPIFMNAGGPYWTLT